MRSFPSRRNSCMLARYHATYSAVDRVLVGVLVLACGSYSPSPRRHQCLFGAMYRCILDRRKHANVAREVRTIRFEYVHILLTVLYAYAYAYIRLYVRVQYSTHRLRAANILGFGNPRVNGDSYSTGAGALLRNC